MFSIKINPNKPKLIPYYKGITLSKVTSFYGETVSVSFKKKLKNLKIMYQFGCSNIKNFHRYKIDESSTVDEALIHMGKIIEKKLNISIYIEHEIWIAKLVNRQYDVYQFPLESFYAHRKDEKFYECLSYALSVLFQKLGCPFTDYISDTVIDDPRSEKQYLDAEEYHQKWIIYKLYEKIICRIVDHANHMHKRPNYRKFKNKYPQWMKFLKDIYSLDKYDYLLKDTRPFNLRKMDYEESFVDLDEMYGFRWANNKGEDTALDNELNFNFNERMNNYTSVEFYSAMLMNEKDSYKRLIKSHRMKTKMHKILSNYYECVYY